MILALDLGTTTGFGAAMNGGAKISGRQKFATKPHENREYRFRLFRNFLDQMAAVEKIDCVFYEAVRAHKGVQAAHAYGGFMATLGEWCNEHAIPLKGVDVGTIKKFATGKGNAGKKAVIDACYERFGVACIDDNEADAVALREYALDLERGSA